MDSFDKYISTLSFSPISKGLGFNKNQKAIAKAELDKHGERLIDDGEENWDPGYRPIFLDSQKNRAILNKAKDKRTRTILDSHVPKTIPTIRTPATKNKPKPLIKKLSAKTERKKVTPKKDFIKKTEENLRQNLVSAPANHTGANPIYRLIAFVLDATIVLGFFSVSMVVSILYLRYNFDLNFTPFDLLVPYFAAEHIVPNFRILMENNLTILAIIFGMLLSLLYIVFFSTTLGATPGKIFFNMKPVQANGESLTISKIITHSICFVIFLPTALFSFLSKDGQTFYDKLSKVYVVKS